MRRASRPRPRATAVRTLVLGTAFAVVVSACGDTTSGSGSPPSEAVGATGSGEPDPTVAGSSSTSAGEPSSTGAPATSEGPSAAVSEAPAPDGATGDPTWEEVASGLDEPTSLLVDPRSGDDLVVQLGGRVVTLDGTTVLDLGDRVVRGGERGFLDATATPDGEAIIVHYSGADDGRTVVSRLPVLARGDLAEPSGEQVLLEFEQPASNHNGGSVVFGPDGMLYVALGDGGAGNDAFGNGADPGTPLGAILRLDVTSRPGEVVVPDDNPFVDGGGDERVWAHGLRNPWRIATDGRDWFVADVGQDAVEEITVVPGSLGPHDLGWPDWEGDFCRVDACGRQPLPPVSTLTHADGACSIIGMAVAGRPDVDEGAAFWTDFCDTRVWRLDPGGEVVEDVGLDAPAFALDVDAEGFVVALTTDGRVLRRTRG